MISNNRLQNREIAAAAAVVAVAAGVTDADADRAVNGDRAAQRSWRREQHEELHVAEYLLNMIERKSNPRSRTVE